jgi:hypothetical protein
MRRLAPIDAAAERRQAEAVDPYLRWFRQVREVRLAAFALLAAFTHRGTFPHSNRSTRVDSPGFQGVNTAALWRPRNTESSTRRQSGATQGLSDARL